MARHIYECPMRWSDMDSYRHINNVAFLRYLEEARIDWIFRGTDLERGPDEALLVVRSEIDYRRQLDYRQAPLPIELWVSRIGHASFAVSYEMVDTGAGGERTLYANAKSVLACVDLVGGHPMRLSEERMEFLAKYKDPA